MPQRTILIADNDQDILMLYRFALKQRSDWNIFSAADSSTALTQALELQPNLIVLDVMLSSDMNGLEVCRQITTRSAADHRPVVLVTSPLKDAKIFEAAQAAGAREVWIKPVPPIQFVKHLDKLMSELGNGLTSASGQI